MGFVNLLKNVAAGAATGVAVITALPVMGAVGTITATGLIVGSTAGAAMGAIDALQEEEEV
ncbi:hypothetical protein [Photobacterium rosenbergii]|uniref:hypothetical protein n=1 Tax=Photobacterium rosenbergii TaxID=294936 RepID=UPI001C98FFC8|nr:hypothetical protein [Photobacterium rosenbergii]MBY5949289.1 hypothetical protein [Photobacterium rosenbergii]